MQNRRGIIKLKVKTITKKLTGKRILLCSLLLAIIILLIIPLIRFYYFDSILLGQTPYYHARMAQHIQDKGIPPKDPLMPRPYILNPYHLLLAATSYFFGVYLSSILIPFLLGILSVILFYLILDKLNLEPLKKVLTIAILIASPAFIYTFSTSNSYALPIFLLLLAFYLFIQEKKLFLILSALLFILLSLFSPINSIIAIFLLFSYSINNKPKLKNFYCILPLIILISLLSHLPFYLRYGLPQKITFISSNILINSISDLGGTMGFGVFNLLLIAIGLYVIWKIKKQLIPYSLLFILILTSFYLSHTNLYLNFIFAILAGHGFLTLLKMKWSIKLIKTLTTIILICGLVFSSISYINRISLLPPDKPIINSLEWFASQPPGIVLSHYTNGFWIETIGKKPVLLDPLPSYLPSPNIRFNHSAKIFYSRNLAKTKALLNSYNISYIWINAAMLQGQVWTKEQQGLLFLFRNNETFKNIYHSKDVEIWKVLRD